MNALSLLETGLWWVTVQSIALLALPLSWLLFRSMPAAGYALHKAFGLAVFSFVAWILMSLHVLPNTRWALVVVLVGLGVVSLLVLRLKVSVVQLWSRVRVQAIVVEGLFLVLFAAYAAMRTAMPAAYRSEKFMNLMLVNSILRSPFFPPHDAWAAGLTINYYYFGHLVVAYLTRLTGLPSAVAFNLAQALFFALGGLSGYGVAHALAVAFRAESGGAADALQRWRPTLIGLLGAVMLMLMGNLFAAWKLCTDPPYLLHNFWSGVGWNSARVIHSEVSGTVLDFTINEFPAFSFLLADMHAHAMGLPFVLLAAFTAFTWYQNPDYALRLNLDRAARTLFTAVIFASVYLVNTWLIPGCSVLFGIALLVSLHVHGQRARWRGALVWGLATGILAVLMVSPFVVTFSWPTGGIRWVPYRTQLGQFFLMFGVFVVPLMTVLGLACLVPPAPVEPTASSAQADEIRQRSAGRVFLAWVAATVFLSLVLRTYVLAVCAGSVALGVGLLVWDTERSHAVVFALLLAEVAALLILVPELIYVKDSFGAPGMRANTVYKLHYEAWAFLAPASAFFIAYSAARIDARSRLAAWTFRSLMSLLIGAGLLYSIVSAGALLARTQAATLDGAAFYRAAHADDSRAIEWLVEHAAPGATLIEAVGPEYGEYGRVSTFTGIPAVIGWDGHEKTWRGDPELTGVRASDVALFFSLAGETDARRILHKYGVRYIFLGDWERTRYGDRVQRLVDWFPVLFRSGSVYVLSADGPTS